MEELRSKYTLTFNDSPVKFQDKLFDFPMNTNEYNGSLSGSFDINFEDNSCDSFQEMFLKLENRIDKAVVLYLTKKYPYKSKKKRIWRKWFKQHCNRAILDNIEINGHLWKGNPEPQWEYEAVLKRLKELYLYSL